MNRNLISVVLLLALVGCVVTPRGHVYIPAPVVVGATVGVTTAMIYEQGVVYPEYESAYMWDPMLGVYFFVGSDHRRYYMPHGWGYRTHGVPHYRH